MKAQIQNSDLDKMPMMRGQDGQLVPSMLVRMRCEECQIDHRMIVPVDTPIGALPELTKSTFRCNCKRHIPTITKMDKSLRAINGVPFPQLKGLGLFAGTEWSTKK